MTVWERHSIILRVYTLILLLLLYIIYLLSHLYYSASYILFLLLSNSIHTTTNVHTGNVFNEPLIFRDIGDTHIHTDWWEVFMKYADQMRSGAIMYVPNFIRLVKALKIWWGIHIHTHTHKGNLISLVLFFQNNENRLMIATSASVVVVAVVVSSSFSSK